jgi:hypothetical protein
VGGRRVTPVRRHQPVQKLIVHHTDTTNADPDAAATVRAIYRYHAVTQGWGDLGYNFLVDENGRVYEGRRARDYAGAQVTGEDVRGYGVTGAHTSGFNSGTVGVALLGTLTTRDAAPAARDALERVLAWKADAHSLDPRGTSTYVNPVNGTQKSAPTITGHRDWGATECPGGTFYATLPALRDAVAARVAAGMASTDPTTTATATPTAQPTPVADTTPPPAPSGVSATAGVKRITVAWTAASDPSGIRSYEVFRAAPKATFALLATISTTTYADAVPKGKTYRYYIVATDGAGNRSAPSATVSATAR